MRRNTHLIRGTLPFYDAELGHNERFMAAFKKFGKQENFLNIWQAQEEARRNSLYGPNPGALYCIIKVDRREFPILYEMTCTIVANKDLWNRNGLKKEKIGYSTHEHIIGELKHSITQLLEELHKNLVKINSCSK